MIEYTGIIFSKILTSNEESILNGWMRQRLNKRLKYKLLWRGQWTENFHSDCDNKGATITIFETEQNHVFGAYTKISWTSGQDTGDSWESEYRKDDDVFAYLLRSEFNHDPEVYPIQNGYEKGVIHHRDYGPIFGDAAIRCRGQNVHCQPGHGFNWEGNRLCGGQTYFDENSHKELTVHVCELRGCEIYQVMEE